MCKNCGRALLPEDNYCGNCGAMVVRERITVKHLFTEFYETLFSWESNKPIRTFIDLLRQPEVVIEGYISGVRKKYLSPVGYVVIALTISGIFFFVATHFFPEMFSNYGNAEFSEAAKEAAGTLQRWGMEYNTWLYFILMPIFALMSWIVFYNRRKYNYAEHLILNFYAYSEVSILTIILYSFTIASPSLFQYATYSVFILQMIYYSYVLKRIYSLSLSQLFIKILFFIGLLIPLYIVGVIVALLILYFTGKLDLLLDLANTAQTTYMASSLLNWTS